MTDTPAARLFALGLAAMRARFDADAGLLVTHTDTGAFHPTRESLAFAYALVRAEGEAALPEAEAIVGRVLRAQERQEGNIHRGGFKWMDEDQGVTDLNAVQFALEQLLPFFLDYGERLSDALRAELLLSFRLAAEELERLDVSLSYTNIALLDTLNTLLLGRALGDGRLLARGRRRLDEWIALVGRSGAVLEYNSPTYAAVDLAALAELVERAPDGEVAVKAQIMEERLWLHAAVHFHPATAQLAGPHSRAYHNDVTGGLCGIKQLLFARLGDERLMRQSAYATQRQTPGNVKADRQTYHLPDYLERLMREKPPRYAVAETAEASLGLDLVTFMTPTYALGTSSVGTHAQSNHTILYYRRPDDTTGVLFARYIVNEKRFGSHYHATDRSTANNLNDEGQFWGAQHESKCIALYGLKPQHEPVHSLKTEVYLLDAARLDEVWVNGERVTVGPEPLALRPHDAVLIADGDAYIAIRPLAPENLGREAPILLSERDGELVLSIYNYYRGEAKRFWEYSSLGGFFYHGNIRAGFVLEAGDRDEHGDFAAFRSHILRGAIDDLQEGEGGKVRRVRYASGGDLLELAVDLLNNRPVERRVNGVVYAAPMLDSPTARQAATGDVRVGAAHLACGPAPAWVVADDERGCWAAVSQAEEAAPWRFSTPAAAVAAGAWGFGKLVVRAGAPAQIEALCVRQLAPLTIETGGDAPRVMWNGRDVSAELVGRGGAFVLPIGDRGAEPQIAAGHEPSALPDAG